MKARLPKTARFGPPPRLAIAATVTAPDPLILRAAGLAVLVCAVSGNSHRKDADLSPPAAESYPAFANGFLDPTPLRDGVRSQAPCAEGSNAVGGDSVIFRTP